MPAAARYVAGAVAAVALVLVVSGGARAAAPAACPAPLQVDGWSPDGQRVAFEGPLDPRETGYLDAGGVVGIARADGTGTRVVSQTPFAHRYDEDGGLVFAPDGRSVAYVHDVVVGSDPGGEPRYASILVVVDLATGRRVDVRGAWAPSFVPDLAYLAPKGIVVGGRLIARGTIDGVDWSPDGKHVAFARPGKSTYDELVLTDAHGRHDRVLARSVDAAYPYFAWATHGDRLAYIVDDTRLYVARADGSRARRLTTDVWESQFALSPDGRRIAYVVGGLDEPAVLVLAGADGSKRVEIATTDGQAAIAFAWSPDSRRIAYTSGVGNDLFVASADGSQSVPLGVSGVEELLWSPDARRLVAGTALVDVSAGTHTTLLGDAAGGAWSAGGSRFAYGAADGLQVIRQDGTVVTSVHLCTS